MHLQNAADNEEIEIAEVSGTVARDIDGAIAEMDALVYMTKAKEGVYAAFINPPVPLTREQFMRAIALLEERLGLIGQPRIILFHVKNGRHHCHLVWSRIDIDAQKAIHMSHDRQKLRKCAQELAAEFGFELPFGLQHDRGAERFNEPKRPTRAEKSMAEKSGLTVEERRAVITDAYRRSDSAEAFQQALEEAGFLLARGDSRAFVVVDVAGDVHSLARQIDGAKTKDVKAKLAGLNLSLLPPVEKAKILMLQRYAAQLDAARAEARRRASGEAEYQKLSVLQKKRKGDIDLLWQRMKIRHMHEWKVLLAHIRGEQERHLARKQWNAWGLAVYLKKIAVIRQLIEYYERRQKRTMEEHHAALKASVRRRHENEAAELKRRYAALERLERREFVSFEQQYVGTSQSGLTQPGLAVTYEPRTGFGPDWAFNAADITQPPTVKVISPVLEDLADILVSKGPRPESVSSAVEASFSSLGSGWDYFHENVADVTHRRILEERMKTRTERPKPDTTPADEAMKRASELMQSIEGLASRIDAGFSTTRATPVADTLGGISSKLSADFDRDLLFRENAADITELKRDMRARIRTDRMAPKPPTRPPAGF